MNRKACLAAVVPLLAPLAANAAAPSPEGLATGAPATSLVSLHTAAGASLALGRPEILEGEVIFGTAFDLGAAFHLTDWLAVPLELRYRTASVGLDRLQSRWIGFDTSTVLVGSGASFAVLGTERYELRATARGGLALQSSEVIDRTDFFAWSSSGPYAGAGIDVAVFPLAGARSLEVGLAVSGDAIFTSMESDQRFAWETEPADRVDVSTALLFRAGWHL
ncbi:hypothetical protein [Vulgatibacter sp.]|uniref:hypothetical protein n=1 Tax=Vulgatibacter sp. TaxID=1971226 RepID=UPI00356AC5B6